MTEMSTGGWISGASAPTGWYKRVQERRAKFLANHPEWTIVYVRSLDQHEASKGDTDSALVILHDRSLGTLMDRLETEYPDPPVTGV